MFRQKQSLTLVAALLLALGLGLPARAQEALFSSDVTMDTTGTDATDARAKAMKKAGRDGLASLLEKLAPEQKTALMSRLEDDIIAAMVKSIDVQDEKISGNRYRALLRVNYNALAVNALLDKKVSAAGAEKEETHSDAVLVIPLYEEDGQLSLWEPAGTWREIWRRVVLETGGGHIVAPYGDGPDIAAITAESLQSANYAALAPFFTRYGVAEVAVLKATWRPGDPPGLDIVKREIGKDRSDAYVLDYRADPQEDKAALLYRAAKDLATQLNHAREENSSRAAVMGQTEGKIMALVPLSTLDRWTSVRAILLKMPSVTRVEVSAISARQVDIIIQFKGTATGLAADLQGAGLRVREAENYWVVSKD